MMTAILPDLEIPIKTLTSDRLGDVSSEVETEPPSGSIVIQIGLSGSYSVQILACQSDEEDILRKGLTAAGPLIEQLQRMFTVEPLTRIQ